MFLWKLPTKEDNILKHALPSAGLLKPADERHEEDKTHLSGENGLSLLIIIHFQIVLPCGN